MQPWDHSPAKASSQAPATVIAAREAREARERARLQTASVIRIQSLVRGFLARTRLRATQRSLLTTKLSDIAKLSSALALAKNTFVVPAPILVTLLQSACYAQSPPLSAQVANLVATALDAGQPLPPVPLVSRLQAQLASSPPHMALLGSLVRAQAPLSLLERPLMANSNVLRTRAGLSLAVEALAARPKQFARVFCERTLATPLAGPVQAPLDALWVELLRVEPGPAHLGNVLAILSSASDNELGDALPALTHHVRHCPAHVLAGEQGVQWSDQARAVLQTDPQTLEQLSRWLESVFLRMLKTCLGLDSAALTQRKQADRRSWTVLDEELLQMVEPELRMPRPRLVEQMVSSLSSWAGRLGLITPTPQSPAASPPAAPSPAVASALFKSPPALGEAALALLETWFTRFPPSSQHPRSLSLLNALVFGFPLPEACWYFYESSQRALPALSIFALSLSHLALIADDAELYDDTAQAPLPRAALERAVRALNQLPPACSPFCRFRAARLLSQLYDFHSRRPLIRPQAWLVPGAEMPQDNWWTVPFAKRAALLSARLAAGRSEAQQPNEPPAYRLQVRRKTAFNDALNFFAGQHRVDLRKRVYVEFINDLGAKEAGIDARGLFKEFLNLAAEHLFDPKRGLFCTASQGDGSLFPNSSAGAIHGAEAVKLFDFAGRLLGKAVWEQVTLQPQFSFLLLSKLLRKQSSLADLQTLDADLYKNLCFLKSYTGDFADLGLVFCTSSGGDGLRPAVQVELVPNGSHIPVTRGNRFRFINAMAHYRLNVESNEYYSGFARGFYSVVDFDLVACFSERELQIIFSGKAGGVDMADLRRHTSYAGGYSDTALSPVIQWFWQVCEVGHACAHSIDARGIQEMSEADRAALLKFCTSCARPPVLGFGDLQPRFTIQRVSAADSPLPTSATCFNVLKLPSYASKTLLKEKLLLAIRSGSGFELT